VALRCDELADEAGIDRDVFWNSVSYKSVVRKPQGFSHISIEMRNIVPMDHRDFKTRERISSVFFDIFVKVSKITSEN